MDYDDKSFNYFVRIQMQKKNITTRGNRYYLVSEKNSYTLGRKNTDINLAEDSSISRIHCTINIAKKSQCPFPAQYNTGVWIVDKKSKYGTYLYRNQEWVKINEEENQELYNGSVIRFGLLESIYRLEYKPLIACTSRISNDQKQEVKSMLSMIDGELLGHWVNQCTIVFVNDITLTVKVILALINGIPIVTTHYLKELVGNVRQNLDWPDVKKYTPDIKESTLISHLVSLNNGDHRKELFKGKKFIVPTREQYENLKMIIESAGGNVEILQLSQNWKNFADENIIVIQLSNKKIIDPDENAKKFKTLAGVLKTEHHVRVIPEAEIFQAIAYSSIENYCNPRSQFSEIRYSANNYNSYGTILEEETPSQGHRSSAQSATLAFKPHGSSSVLKENNTESSSGKKRSHSPEYLNTPKRLALEASSDHRTNISTEDDRMVPERNGVEGSSEFQIQSKTTVEKNLSNFLQNLNVSKQITSKENLDNNNQKNPKTTQILDEEVDEFWNEPINRRQREENKRKVSENFSEASNSPSETRKRILEEDKNCKKLDSNNRSIPRGQTKDVTENNFTRKRPPESLMSSVPKVGNDELFSGWIRRRTANYRSDETSRDFDRSEWLNKNVKKFKKKPKYETQTKSHYTREDLERLSQTLLGEGWKKSRVRKHRLLSNDE